MGWDGMLKVDPDKPDGAAVVAGFLMTGLDLTQLVRASADNVTAYR